MKNNRLHSLENHQDLVKTSNMPPVTLREHTSSEGGHCPFRLCGHFKKKLPPWSTTLFFLHIPLKLLLMWGPHWSSVKPSKMQLAVGNIIEIMFKSNIITNKWPADAHATCALALQPCFHEAVPIAHFNASSAMRWQGCRVTGVHGTPSTAEVQFTGS